MNEFVKPGSEGEITLLDIASGQLDHLNLKHVVCLFSEYYTWYSVKNNLLNLNKYSTNVEICSLKIKLYVSTMSSETKK